MKENRNKNGSVFADGGAIAWFLGKLVKAASEKRAGLFEKRVPVRNGSWGPARSKVNRSAPAIATDRSTATKKWTDSIVGPISGKNFAIDMNRPFDPGEFSEVYDFYRDIAPGIRMRELMVKKLPKADQEAFSRLLKTPVYWATLPQRTAGRTDKAYGRILLNKAHPENDKRVTLVHELRHMLATMLPASKRSTDALQNTYGFIGKEIRPGDREYSRQLAEEEMYTTNKEHQFKSYLELRKSLGRKPTSSEFFQYLKDQRSDQEKIEKDRSAYDNVYQQTADKIMGQETRRATIWDYLNAKMNISKASRIRRNWIPAFLKS